MRKLILALDVNEADYAIELAKRFSPHIDVFKVGLELFTVAGAKVVEGIQKQGSKVFLDLKFHDIPNTVAAVSSEAARMGVYMFNVHASGGLDMMKACRDAVTNTCLKENIERPLLLGVTVLTSISNDTLKDELCVHHTARTHVKHLARLTQRAGLDGVVASAQEARLIRDKCGDDFVIVTPGIRPTWDSADDQKRTSTPSQAKREGADFLVMGRSILKQDNPEKALELIYRELEPRKA